MRWPAPLVLAWLLGCHAAPRERPCREPPLPGRTVEMTAPRSPIDPLADMPEQPRAAAPERSSPLAFVRAGDAISRREIGAARSALDARACGAIRAAAERLPPGHADRDYLLYLAAWCEHLTGNHRIAFAELARLVQTRDASLALSVGLQLAVLRARDGSSPELARQSLADLGLWRGAVIDRYASELLGAGRLREALRVVEEEPADTPEAGELACREQAERCRAVPRGTPGQLAACRVPRVRASEACGRWLRLGLVRALVDFPGATGYDTRPAAAPWVRELIAEVRDEVPALRDRLDLVGLAATHDVRTRDAAAWLELADRAEALARAAVDRAVVAPASAIAAAARRNAQLLLASTCARRR